MAQVSFDAMVVMLNGKPLSAPSGVLTGDQFRDAALIPEGMKLWRQNRTGRGDDELIAGPGIVTFNDGDVLYTAPKSI